jgi:hypothetical protein
MPAAPNETTAVHRNQPTFATKTGQKLTWQSAKNDVRFYLSNRHGGVGSFVGIRRL